MFQLYSGWYRGDRFTNLAVPSFRHYRIQDADPSYFSDVCDDENFVQGPKIDREIKISNPRA